MIGRIWRGLTRSRAATRPDHPDPALRGRTYFDPFPDVWRAVGMEATSHPRWSIAGADPRTGTLRIEAGRRFGKGVHDVRVFVSLDENGFTRVDVDSRSRRGPGDFGVNARRIREFLRALDRRLPGP